MIEIIEERYIPWELQSKIHRGLNVAYNGISKNFMSKTYADIVPFSRAIDLRNDEVVAHIAIAFDQLKLGDEWIDIAELGLCFSSLAGGATEIMTAALNHLKKMKRIPFALGRSNNDIMYNYIAKKLPTHVHHIPIIGKTHTSKQDDRALFFNVNMSEEDFSKIVEEIVSYKQIIIAGEPF
jgi:hypothetical protein